jgi:hypothetical protein
MLIRQHIQGHEIQSNNLVKIGGALGIKKRKPRLILQKRRKRRWHFDLVRTITGTHRDWMVPGVSFVVTIASCKLQTTSHYAHVYYNIKKALMTIRKTFIGFGQTA